MIDWKTGRWKYSSDLIYMGDKKIKEIWMGDKKVYPEDGGGFIIRFNRSRSYNNSIYAIGYYANGRYDDYRLFKYDDNGWHHISELPYDKNLTQYAKSDDVLEVYDNKLRLYNHFYQLPSDETEEGYYDIAIYDTPQHYNVYRIYDYIINNGNFILVNPYPHYVFPRTSDRHCTCVYNDDLYLIAFTGQHVQRQAVMYRLKSIGDIDDTKFYDAWELIDYVEDGVLKPFVCNGYMYIFLYYYQNNNRLYKFDGSDLTYTSLRPTYFSYGQMVFAFNNNIYSLETHDYMPMSVLSILNGSKWQIVGNIQEIRVTASTEWVVCNNKLHIFPSGFGSDENYNYHWVWDGTTWENLGLLEIK